MTRTTGTLLAAACILAAGCERSPGPQASPGADPSTLTGRWQLSWDTSPDGRFQAEGGFPIELVERDGLLVGKAAPEAPPGEQSSRFEGSVRRGDRTRVELRQLRGGYVGTLSAELVEGGRFAGTWSDNEGNAGEVELVRKP